MHPGWAPRVGVATLSGLVVASTNYGSGGNLTYNNRTMISPQPGTITGVAPSPDCSSCNEYYIQLLPDYASIVAGYKVNKQGVPSVCACLILAHLVTINCYGPRQDCPHPKVCTFDPRHDE